MDVSVEWWLRYADWYWLKLGDDVMYAQEIATATVSIDSYELNILFRQNCN